MAGDAAFASGFATIVNAAIFLNGRPPLSIGAEVGIGIGIAFVWAVQNALRIDRQGWLNNIAAFFQIASSIVIVIVLFVMTSDRATARDVFTSTNNGTGFPFPYVCCISILSTLFSFSGYEAGAHLAEETRGAGRAGDCSSFYKSFCLMFFVFFNSSERYCWNLCLQCYCRCDLLIGTALCDP